MKAIYWRLFIIRLALRWISKPNLGDEVIYQGRRWTLIQGVCDPVWSLFSGDERIDVHRDQFRKVPGIRSAWQSFRSGYRFYMTSWYGIWKREGVQPWMRGCHIWAGKPPRTGN
jgi:hypothetical protein